MIKTKKYLIQMILMLTKYKNNMVNIKKNNKTIW